MSSTRTRRLAFELLEPKASPSALLLALAPLDETTQRAIEFERSAYAATVSVGVTHSANVALLEYIDQHTQERPELGHLKVAIPTPAQAAEADKMMQATDTDLRCLLIVEMLAANSAVSENVCSVIQY